MISSMERNIRFSNLMLEDYNTLKSHYQFKLLESLQNDSNFKAILEASNSNIKPKAELKREAEKLAKNGNEVIAKFGKAVLKFLATGTKALADLGLAISGMLAVGGGVLATCITLVIGIILFAALVVPFGALVSVLIKVDKSLGSYLHKTSPDKNVEKYKTLSKNIQKQKDGIKDINDLDKLIRVSEALDTVKDYPDMVPVGEAAEILRLISVIEAKEQTAPRRKKSDPTPKEIHDEKVAEREKTARKVAKEKENNKSPKEIHDEIEAERAKVKKEKLDADMAKVTEAIRIKMEIFGDLAPEHLVVTEGLFNPSGNTPIMESVIDDTDVFMALENATSKPMLSGNSLLDSMIAITTEACNEESILKFLNRYKNTVVYEMTHEKYRDLPIIMETGLCLKYIRENCSDIDKVMESCDQLDQLLGEIVSESECELIEDASQFNPDPCGLGSLTPFPVADRAVGNALCDIESAETDEELTEALIQFGRISSMINESYYVDGDMMIMRESAGSVARKAESKSTEKFSKVTTKDRSKGPVAAVKHTVDPICKWIDKTMATIREKDMNERREIVLMGGDPTPKILRWVKRSIPLIALGAAGTVVPAASVIAGISLIGMIATDKTLDKRARESTLRSLEQELEIVNEKIEDSKGSGDSPEARKKKYELMRIRSEITKQMDKIKYNLKY